VDDFCRRVDARVVHKRVVESLIKVGALDVLGRRSQLLDALDRILGDVQRQQRAAANGQGSIFDLMGGDISAKEVQTLALPDIPEAPNETLLTWEKELLGISFTEHPLNQVLVKMRRHTTAFCSSISTDMKGQRVTMVGVLTNPRQVTTKKGDSMVISRLEDLEGGVDLVVFPRTFQQTAEVWQPDAIVVVEARVDVREDRAQLVCEKARLYSEPEAEEDGPVVAQVAEKREAYPGDDYPPQDDNWYPVEDDVSFDTLPPGDSPHPSPFPEGEGTQLEASSAGEGPAISPQRGEPQRGALPADEAYPHPSPLPEGEGTPRGAGPNGEGSRPGHGSRKLYITFRRTGDEARDMRIFHETLALLRHHPGNDPVGLTIITGAGLAVDMEWPDLTIRYSRQLEAQLADVVGPEGLRLAGGPASITGA
jgi:DNA polymerase-3 subunit alpha